MLKKTKGWTKSKNVHSKRYKNDLANYLNEIVQKAKDNAARDGYSGHSYTWEEIEPLVVPRQ